MKYIDNIPYSVLLFNGACGIPPEITVIKMHEILYF